MNIVQHADYIVTDGGGLQEDAFFLGIPTLIHRKTTERQDGLGSNAQLSEMKIVNVTHFLKHHKSKNDFKKQADIVSPSAVVTDYLKDHQYISRTTK